MTHGLGAEGEVNIQMGCWLVAVFAIKIDCIAVYML